MVSDPVAIKKQLLALKFLDDIKIEREKKRRREREKRRKEITKKIGEKSNSTTEQQVEASSGIYKKLNNWGSAENRKSPSSFV